MITEFTPWESLAGGVLIGAAAVLLMFLHGRIAGATGILTGVFTAPDKGWRIAILAGMAAAAVLILIVTGAPVNIQVPLSTLELVIGGLIVGVGVTFGSGCTSGHGVCGMARLSPRSIVATLVFMATTTATVFFVRHVIGG